MFIFYDLETTGTNTIYDQILQFGAILVDDDLSEIARFEICCRLLPWVVPSPGALLVTDTSTSQLEDGSLPDFFEMMRLISKRLASWPPATFVGYNSMRFDEPFLQRAFWQALLPPYVTVMGGNSRLDVLTIVRAAAFFRPKFFNIPLRDNGAPSFRLDELAPANGFNAHRAHDAMGDVEATLFLAKKIARVFPELWIALSARAPKLSSAALLNSGEPIFLFQHGGDPPLSCYHRVDKNGASGSYAILANLGYNWQNTRTRIDALSDGETAMMRKALRRVALNKAPPILSLTEGQAIAGRVPTAAELKQAEFLANNRDYCFRISEFIEPFPRSQPNDTNEIEEMIFDGFASAKDERLMAEFHHGDPQKKVAIAAAFSDPRFRRLAMRIIYVCAPHVLRPREHEQMQLRIARRLDGVEISGQPWRTVIDAISEIRASIEQAPSAEKQSILTWLTDRQGPPMSS